LQQYRECHLAAARQLDELPGGQRALIMEALHPGLATIPEAEALARHPSAHVRAAALRYAAATSLMSGQRMLAAALDDADVRVASLAVALLVNEGWELPGTFDALTRLIPRLPGKVRTADAVGVEQAPVKVSQAEAAGCLVSARGQRPVSVLLPWLPSMDANGRLRVAMQIRRQPTLTAELRKVLVELLGDRSSLVRGHVIEALGRTRLAPSEAPAIEALLTRGAADIRRGALTLLASLPPKAARASADRLAASADKGQRDAATELLRAVGAAGTPAVPRAAPIEDLRTTLIDARARSAPLIPRWSNRCGSFGGNLARRVVEALDEIAEENRDTPVLASSW